MSEAVGRPLGACEEEMPALACVVLMGWLWGAGVLESRTAPRKLHSLQQPGNGGGGGGERVFTENCSLSIVVELCPPKRCILESYPPLPQNSTTFGDEIFMEGTE